MRVDVILFDADGTLFDFQRAERHALTQTMARFDLEYDDDARHPALYATINRELWRQFEQGTQTCWFNPSGAANGIAIAPVFEVASLWELRDRLGDVS